MRHGAQAFKRRVAQFRPTHGGGPEKGLEVDLSCFCSRQVVTAPGFGFVGPDRIAPVSAALRGAMRHRTPRARLQLFASAFFASSPPRALRASLILRSSIPERLEVSEHAGPARVEASS